MWLKKRLRLRLKFRARVRDELGDRAGGKFIAEQQLGLWVRISVKTRVRVGIW